MYFCCYRAIHDSAFEVQDFATLVEGVQVDKGRRSSHAEETKEGLPPTHHTITPKPSPSPSPSHHHHTTIITLSYPHVVIIHYTTHNHVVCHTISHHTSISLPHDSSPSDRASKKTLTAIQTTTIPIRTDQLSQMQTSSLS